MKIWLCAALAVLTAAAGREASAAITIQDGIPWVYSIESGQATILHGPGRGCVTIPPDLDGYPVRSIANAFYGCSGLTSVTIPDSVTSIEESAFSGCSGLTSVTIGNGVWDIGTNAFHFCWGLTNVTIGNGVRNIGAMAFDGCSGLTSVTIPGSVTNIGDYAFRCDGMKAFSVASDNPAYQAVSGLLLTKDGKTLIRGVNGDVIIPNSVTSITNSAFSGCHGLTSVTIPDSVTSIEGSAFSGCSGLTSVTIGNGVTSIGAQAFESCIALASLSIPDSVTRIGGYAFVRSGLKTLYVPASWEGTTKLQSAGVPEGCTVIYGMSPEPTAEARYAAWLESFGKTAAELPMGVDSDDDGMSNWEECVAGTNPLDAEDRFEARIRKVDGKIVVDSSAENTGRVYRVHGTADLVGDEGREPIWNDVTDEEDLSRTDCRYFKMEARFAD